MSITIDGSTNTVDSSAASISVTKPIVATSIQNTPIGSTTPSTGAFTTLSASDTITSNNTIFGNRTHATTTAQLAIVDCKAISSGDMVDGFGPQVRFIIRDTAAVDNLIASIASIRDGADNTGAVVVNVGVGGTTQAAKFSSTGLAVTGTIKTSGYTVATLPAGAAGDRAYVTDATAPTYLGALTGGGAVVCPVFKNASAWVSA